MYLPLIFLVKCTTLAVVLVYIQIQGPPHEPQHYFKWINWEQDGGVPEDAVLVGLDLDHAEIYLGRAYCGGELRPGKFLPHHRVIYTSWGLIECVGVQLQVLVGRGFSWVSGGFGYVPCNAVVSGALGSGEIVYSGRTTHNGTVTAGAIIPSNALMYATFGGREYGYERYEVLVSNQIECGDSANGT